eukprot:m.180230 g.180230  ORF g.180230 m.180230 type:complete len:435 (+) comp32012_c1_seq1:50-1354(+)
MSSQSPLSNVPLMYAVTAGVAALGLVYSLRQLRKSNGMVVDSQAAFPTAQWVAAMRATDAKSTSPRIGSNIGAGPDLAAETLAGELGFTILDEMDYHGGSRAASSKGVVERTLYFDQQFMQAVDAGVKQFVILAAGLDARAWRLPRLDASHTIFEVDCPRSHEYKESKIATLELSPPKCRRVAVNADLSQSQWTDTLTAAGFKPDEPCFVLIEGLLMYLPPSAPATLLAATAKLMAPGSTLTGDTIVNMLFLADQSKLQKFGTQWTFEIPSDAGVVDVVEAAGLHDVTVVDLYDLMAGATLEAFGPEFEAEKVKAFAGLLKGFVNWPAATKQWVVSRILKDGKAGVTFVADQVIQDTGNHQGMRDVAKETKTNVAKALLTDDFVEEMVALANTANEEISKIPWLTRTTTFLKFAFLMMRNGGKKSSYVMYTAKK